MGIFSRTGKAKRFGDRRYRDRLTWRLAELDDWLRGRLRGRAPNDQIDLVLAHYLFGATAAVRGKPKDRLQFCLEVMTEVIGAQRAYMAICEAPDELSPTVGEFCRKMEIRGVNEAPLLME